MVPFSGQMEAVRSVPGSTYQQGCKTGPRFVLVDLGFAQQNSKMKTV
jgi:hypothetical protein